MTRSLAARRACRGSARRAAGARRARRRPRTRRHRRAAGTGRTAAVDTDGEPRPLEQAAVTEITGLLPPSTLASYPTRTRVIVRRERPHPGAQLDLIEQCAATATPPTRPTPAPANHRVRPSRTVHRLPLSGPRLARRSLPSRDRRCSVRTPHRTHGALRDRLPTGRPAMYDPTLSPRRVRRAADAALRANVRRRERIDRYARTALTPPPGGLIGRILAVVRPQPDA